MCSVYYRATSHLSLSASHFFLFLSASLAHTYTESQSIVVHFFPSFRLMLMSLHRSICPSVYAFLCAHTLMNNSNQNGCSVHTHTHTSILTKWRQRERVRKKNGEATYRAPTERHMCLVILVWVARWWWRRRWMDGWIYVCRIIFHFYVFHDELESNKNEIKKAKIAENTRRREGGR